MNQPKVCRSCGMPMKKEKDFGGCNSENDYCLYCCEEDGTLKSRDNRVDLMAAFIKKTKGVSEEIAREEADKRIPKE